MAQHDQVIDNGPGLAVRTDINAAIAALFSSSSGTVQPAVMVAGQWFFNTSTGAMQYRNAANTAWVNPSAEMGGVVNVSTAHNYLQFQGTSIDTNNSLVRIRDNRTTVGAEGNNVFAIKRQNSTTDALIFGNDANGAGLIGGNNTPLRLGKWVSGVFTEYLNMSTAGRFSITGDLIVDPPSAVTGIQILPSDANSGRLFFNTSAANNWSLSAWDTAGELRFAAGGTYGSSTGTTVAQLLPRGEWHTAAEQIAAYSIGITRGYLQPVRSRFGVYSSFNPYWMRQTDDGTADGAVTMYPSSFLLSTAAAATNGYYRIQDGGGVYRLDCYYDGINNGAVLYARSAANARIGYIAIKNSDGSLWRAGPTGPEYEVVDTGNLPALMTYTGSDANYTNYPVGTTLYGVLNTLIARNATVTVRIGSQTNNFEVNTGTGTALAGTWKMRGCAGPDERGIVQRVA